MSKRNPKSVEEKLEVVHLYLEQEKSIGSLSMIVKKYSISSHSVLKKLDKP